MERTFEPMGVASMRFARSMPAASMRLTWAGSFAPLAFATSAGMRLSSTSVVLPEPDTPVTAVRRPRGIATSSGFTVCSAPVASSMLPCANTSAAGTRSRTRTISSPERKPPINEAGFASTSASVPCATIRPPSAPAPGPISTSQSAAARMRVSWSTMATELPSASRSRITSTSPSMLEGCRPMDGSSSTYSTPVVRLRTARASCTRWRSPVDSVEPARSSAR